MSEWRAAAVSGGENCVEVGAWRAASCNGGQCVEVGQGRAVVGVRDTEDPGPVLVVTPAAWEAFLGILRGDGLWPAAREPGSGDGPSSSPT